MCSIMGRAYPPHTPRGGSLACPDGRGTWEARPPGSELALVVEHPVALPLRRRREAVAPVEAPRAGVALVDVNLEELRVALADMLDRAFEQGGADAAAAEVGAYVELVEQGDGALVPDVRAQRDEREAAGRLAGEQGDRGVGREQFAQAGGERRRAGRWRLELGVEVVQQRGHDVGVAGGGDADHLRQRPVVVAQRQPQVA